MEQCGRSGGGSEQSAAVSEDCTRSGGSAGGTDGAGGTQREPGTTSGSPGKRERENKRKERMRDE